MTFWFQITRFLLGAALTSDRIHGPWTSNDLQSIPVHIQDQLRWWIGYALYNCFTLCSKTGFR